jgi:hypothetical protein
MRGSLESLTSIFIIGAHWADSIVVSIFHAAVGPKAWLHASVSSEGEVRWITIELKAGAGGSF